MKLPNYHTSQLWRNLRNQMGAADIVKVDTVKYHGLTKKELDRLTTKSLKVETLDDIVNAEDGSFEFKGNKVLVYIKEQRTSIWGSNYKYHISQCSTITDQQRRKRYNRRYVQTARVDGFFEVIQQYRNHEDKKFIKMDVCINCLKHMRNNYRNDNLFSSFSNFSINKYFQSYSNKIKALPSSTPQSNKGDNYSSDWSKLSRAIREENNWVCEGCGESFLNLKAQLHVHHKNGVRNDNKESNLVALCKSCHSDQPGHKHMMEKKNHYGKQNIKSKISDNQSSGYNKPIDVEQIRSKNFLQSYDCEKIIERGEGERIEFKSALKWNKHRKCDDVEITMGILRTVAAFMNTEGGLILIGIKDDGTTIGIDKSFKNFDKANLYFGNKFNKHFETHLSFYCKWDREKFEERNIMIITVKPASKPVYFNPGNDIPSEFWIRQGARKTQLEAKDIFQYITNRFN